MNQLSRFTLAIATVLISPLLVNADSAPSIQLRNGRISPSAVAASVQTQLVGKHLIVQFDRQLTEFDRAQLADRGLSLLDYIPENAWVAKMVSPLTDADFADYGVRWMGQIATSQKISPLVGMIPEAHVKKRVDGSLAFAVVLHPDEDAQAVAEQLRISLGGEFIGIVPSTNTLDIYLPETAYQQVAELDAVQWIEPYVLSQEEHNDVARTNTKADIAQAPPYNLDGAAIVVAEWDGGGVSTTHPDLSGRVTVVDGSAPALHATHVAGTVIGNGTNSGGAYRGMAPAASIVSQLWWGSSSEAFNEYQAAIQFLGMSLGTNSWGYSVGDPATEGACQDILGTYYAVDATLDNIVRGSGGRPVSIVWSAGNQRGTSSSYCGSLGWTYGTIDGLACSKNVIAVGAINSNNSTMTSFSSWGPTDDGRIKPDVVGPGCQSNGDGGVTSTNTSNGYSVLCGTSMSAPAVAGVLALMYQQQYLSHGAAQLLPSSVKGILINSATDLGSTGPDYQYGHGRVDAEAAAKKVAIGDPSFVESELSHGNVVQYDLTVPGGTTRLKATLVWDDPGGTSISGNALINDLDLVLIDPFSVETKPWVMNPAVPSASATRDFNRRDNVETVEIVNPQAGLWKARVSGYNIPTGPQKYSLVFTPDNIYQPGQTLAMAVYDDGDRVLLPGSSTSVNFWVTNVGGAPDSIRVLISDNLGWVTSTVDTIVLLAPYDSVQYTLGANVPASALAIDSTIVNCVARSLTDTNIVTQDPVIIRAAAVYSMTMTGILQDTAASPEEYGFAVQIKNTGNAVGIFDVTPSSPDGWMVTPPFSAVTINAGDSASLSFTLSIPEEVAHESSHALSTSAVGPTGIADTVITTLHLLNPVFPPSLTSPDTVVFIQNRRPTFEWSGVGDSYTLLIGKDTNMAVVVKTYTSLLTPTFTIASGDSLLDGEYFWAVKKYVAGDSSSIQRFPRRMIVDNIAPAAVAMHSPAPNSATSTAQTTFLFSEDGGLIIPGTAPEYSLLQVAADAAFTLNLQTHQPITGSTFTLPAPLADGRWYWRVQRADLAGNISLTPSALSYIVDTQAPDLPIQEFPQNNGTVSSLPIPLRWSSTPPVAWETSREYYYLHISKLADFTDYTFTGWLYADSFLLASPILGQTYYWRVKAADSAGLFTAFTSSRSFKYQLYICGDVTGGGGSPDLSDLSYLIAYLVASGNPPPVLEASSFNCDTNIDLTDLSLLIAYLTAGNVTLCCP
jgi:subtilisin family serine protease